MAARARLTTAQRLLEELRRRREPLAAPQPRPVYYPAPLFGCFIYVPGKGVIGQYVSHHEYTLDGERVWDIDYGVVALYVRVGERGFVPVAFGFAVPGASELLEMGPVYEFVHVLGRLKAVPVRRIFNIELIESGVEPAQVLVVDAQGIMPEGVRADYAEYLARARVQLAQLSRVYSELSRAYEEERTARLQAEAQARALLLLLSRMRSAVYTLSAVAVELEGALERISHRMHQLSERLGRRELTIEALQAELDEIQGLLSASVERYSQLRREVERIAREEVEAEERAAAAPAAAPQQPAAGAGGGGG